MIRRCLAGAHNQSMSPGYGPGEGAYHSPPMVSVTDYGSSYPRPDMAGPDNRGYEEDYAPVPTDFDALFSGKTRPSGMVRYAMYLCLCIDVSMYLC